MNILLLGATGRLGSVLLDELLARGHRVHALVRDAGRVRTRSEALRVFEGSTLDEAALDEALAGCTAVISALNVSRKSDFPWAPLRTPTDLLSKTTETLIRLVQSRPEVRLITCSAWGTNETKAHIPGWFRWFIDHSNIGPAYRDHERQEDLLAASGLNYTVIRPVGLTNGPRRDDIRVTENNLPKPSLTVSRKSVAAFMAGLLDSKGYERKMIAVSG